MSEKTVTMSVDMSGINRLINSLQAGIDEAVRPAAQAGAQVIYDEVKRNVGRMGKVTGNLDRAIYQVFARKDSDEKRATYYVSWNYTKAPHGHLLEFGHWMRYQAVMGRDGRWHTLVRPGMQGKKKPNPRNRAAMDAYYVPRKGGPIFVKGRRFIRNAEVKFPQAVKAVETEIVRRLGEI